MSAARYKKKSDKTLIDKSPAKPIFTNKEISWLSFNARVLQEAADPDVPLLERLKYLGIYSSNLDEFFRVRVATMKRLALLGKKAKKITGYDPAEILKAIQDIVIGQQKEFDEIYARIIDELAQEKIYIINEKELGPNQIEYVKRYFAEQVRPKIFPIMIDQVGQLPILRDRHIHLAVSLGRKDSKKVKYALIEVPTDVLPRFLVLPQIADKRFVILLDDVIRCGLPDIFSLLNYDQISAYTIKLTRDAELDIDDDLSQSYFKKVSKSLRRRKGARPVRFIYASDIPVALLNLLTRKLHLGHSDTLLAGGRYHNFRDFMNFPDFGATHLKYKPTRILPHPEIKSSSGMTGIIDKKDLLLHYTYQSFDYVIDLLREASLDPKVTSIKTTIYRAARDSNVINALINAAKNGKSVVAILELQARFDEEANLNWGNILVDEGVKVIYGVPGLKVHSKLCLITRKKRGKPHYHAIIGTGNLNEETAKIYSDHGLFTSDKRLTGEVKKIFDFFENNYKVGQFKHLIVSPFNARDEILARIRREMENALAGKKASIFIKLNNLVDTEIIEVLYQASQAGVEVKLIVRSMFSLVPGVKNLSDNIHAISIVDKYLEHTRILVFYNDGTPEYFISSADLMPRNLDSRVEVTCPIYDKKLQKELQLFLDIQWRDNIKARILDKALENNIRRKSDTHIYRAQFDFYDELKKRLSKAKSSDSKPQFSGIDGINR